MKRIVAVLLALLLLVSLLVACKKDTASDETTKAATTKAATTKATTTTTTKGPPKTVVAILRQSPTDTWDGSMNQLLIEEKFNLIVKFDSVDWDAYQEKFKLRLATDDLPDMATPNGIDIRQIKEYGGKGVLLDVMTIIDNMPNLKMLMDKYPGHYEYMLTDKNELFVVPGAYTSTFVDPFFLPLTEGGIGIRGDMLDELGVKKEDIKNWDDLYDVFVDMKAANDGNPVFTMRRQLGTADKIAMFWGTSTQAMYFNNASSKWEGSYYKEETKNVIKWLTTAYEDGVLDPDWPTTSADIWYQQAGTGILTAYFDSHGHLGYYDTKNKEAGIDGAYWTYLIEPPSEGTQYKVKVYNNMYPQMIVGAKTEAPQEIGQLANWLYSAEGYQAIWFGEENVDYIVSNTVPKRLQDINEKAIPADKHDLLQTEEEYLARQAKVPFFWYLYGWLMTSSMDDWLEYGTLMDPFNETTKKIDWYLEMMDKDMIISEPDPTPAFSADESEEVGDLKTQITTLIDETVTKMIIGQLSIENDWDAFIQDLKDMNYDRLIELYVNSQ